MRAAYIEQPGPPESIIVGEMPAPHPAPGEVLVRVRAAAFNPIDLYLRSGMVAMPMAFPYVVGSDLAGTVEAVGRDVSRYQVGDRVWGSNRGMLGRTGSAAEVVAVGEDWLYPTPEGQADVEAAGQALVGITAHLGLFGKAKLKGGEMLYVPGGSGGVGSMVVQMAKAVGARVATSAGSPERVAYCRSIGADLAFNYKTDDIPAGLREFSPEGVDVWFETLREPNFEAIVPMLRKGGRVVVIAGRGAKSVLPVGPFYTRDAKPPRLRDVQRGGGRAAGLRRGDQRVVGLGQAEGADRPDVSPGRGGGGPEVPGRQYHRRGGDAPRQGRRHDRRLSSWTSYPPSPDR